MTDSICMDISATTGASQAALSAEIGVAVARKVQEAATKQGDAVISLLEDAASVQQNIRQVSTAGKQGLDVLA
jgi:hypothetical protein